MLGFELSHTAHQKGELAQEITGVEGARDQACSPKNPGGHKIELFEYLAPADRKRANLRSCDVGSVHVALVVDDLDAVLDRSPPQAGKQPANRRFLSQGPMSISAWFTSASGWHNY